MRHSNKLSDNNKMRIILAEDENLSRWGAVWLSRIQRDADKNTWIYKSQILSRPLSHRDMMVSLNAGNSWLNRLNLK